jgi:hypothetical protein
LLPDTSPINKNTGGVSVEILGGGLGMKTNRGPLAAPLGASLVKVVVSSFLVLGGALSGCGQNRTAKDATSIQTKDKKIEAAQDKNVANSLKSIQEKFEGKSHLLVLEKEYWLGKRIWVSIGIERASVTGLAGSVMGYIPTYLKQVNQLLVLERDNSAQFGSSTLVPEVALNAYPIVEENAAAIVVDVSSPRSEYGLTNLGFYAGPAANAELKPRLEYVKDVSISDDGIAFKNVINAISPIPLFEKGSGSAEETAGLDPYSVSLTIRTDWRLPNPSSDYAALEATAQPYGYFYSAPKITNNGLGSKKYVNRISLSRKHVWEMSANTPLIYQNAVREGVLAWNEALGTEALEVRLAEAGKDNTDPNTSNIIWDDNKAVGFAFANWRDNPDTGEIMQGQVYMSGNMWAEQGGLVYDLRRLEKLLRESLDAARAAQTQSAGPQTQPQKNGKLDEKIIELRRQISLSAKKLKSDLSSPAIVKRGFLSLNGAMHDEIASHKGFCQREIKLDELRDLVAAVVLVEGDFHSTNQLSEELQTPEQDSQQEQAAEKIARTLKHMPYPSETMTRAEFQSNVVRSVVMHEVGHALGLRHNFMGSLETSDNGRIDSASIMDYNDLVVDAQFDQVGDSDRAVIDMGYHRKAPAKPFKFCTDENVSQGVPGCHRHDHSADSVDFFMTSQESALLMGLYFGQRGDMARLVRSINNSLRTGLEMLSYVNMPTAQGMQIDPAFAQKQAKAQAALLASREMYDLPFPEQIISVYDGLSRMVLGASVKAGASQTPGKGTLIADLSATVLDAKGALDKDTRLSGLVGLIKLQDASARSMLKNLVNQLAAQSVLQETERSLELRMMDEFIQNAAEQALDAYYAAANSQ